MTTSAHRGRALRDLFNLQRGETGPVLLAALFFFCILTALMLLRPARDALGMERGIEGIRWLFVGTALATLLVNPLFGGLAARLRRLPLIASTYGFFIAGLAGFWALLVLAPGAVGERSGQVFYVGFSVSNLFVTMVFWALLADCFDSERARRLFALVSVGGTLGAIFGPWLTSRLAQPLGTPSLLLVAAGFLLLGVALAWWLMRMTAGRFAPADAVLDGRAGANAPPLGGSAWDGFTALFRSRYLAGIAGYILLMTLMATFVYFTRLQMVAEVAGDTDARAALLGRIDMWTQVAVLLLQLTLTGRIVKRFGLGVALAILPVATAVGFVGLAIYGSFVVLVLLEATNRAVQRGITRPAREALFTLVGREHRYKAKAIIDTFVYRAGDVAGAQVEGLLGQLGLALGGLATVVAPLAMAWAGLGLWLGRDRAARPEHEAAGGGSARSAPPGLPPSRAAAD